MVFCWTLVIAETLRAVKWDPFIVLVIQYADEHGFLIMRLLYVLCDRLCGLVVRVSGYRYRGPGFDSRRYQIFWVLVGLERGPLSLVSLVRSIEELLE